MSRLYPWAGVTRTVATCGCFDPNLDMGMGTWGFEYLMQPCVPASFPQPNPAPALPCPRSPKLLHRSHLCFSGLLIQQHLKLPPLSSQAVVKTEQSPTWAHSCRPLRGTSADEMAGRPPPRLGRPVWHCSTAGAFLS